MCIAARVFLCVAAMTLPPSRQCFIIKTMFYVRSNAFLSEHIKKKSVAESSGRGKKTVVRWLKAVVGDIGVS
jgi:hypothetical protein